MTEEKVWFEGFIINDYCLKCMEKRPKYLFIGHPRTNPEVSILVCEDCIKELLKDTRFQIGYHQYYEFPKKAKKS